MPSYSKMHSAFLIKLLLFCSFSVSPSFPYALFYSHYQKGESSAPSAQNNVEVQCGKCTQFVDGIPGIVLREHSVREMPKWLHHQCLQSIRQLNIGSDICSHFLTFGPLIRTQLNADGGAVVADNVCSAAKICQQQNFGTGQQRTAVMQNNYPLQLPQIPNQPHQHQQPHSSSSSLTTFSRSMQMPNSASGTIGNGPRTVATYQTGPSPPASPIVFTRHTSSPPPPVSPAQREVILKHPPEMEISSFSRSSQALQHSSSSPSAAVRLRHPSSPIVVQHRPSSPILLYPASPPRSSIVYQQQQQVAPISSSSYLVTHPSTSSSSSATVQKVGTIGGMGGTGTAFSCCALCMC